VKRLKRIWIAPLILLIACLAIGAWDVPPAPGFALIQAGGGSAPPGEDYSDINLFWRCEAEALASGDYPTSGSITTNEHAAITDAAGIIGTNGLELTAGYDNAAVTAYVPGSDVGRIGFWVRHNSSVVNNTELFKIYISTSNYFRVYIPAGSDIIFGNYRAGATDHYISGTSVLSADTNYFVEIAWDLTTSNTIVFYLSTDGSQDTSGTSTSATFDPFDDTGFSAYVGDSGGAGGSVYYDNIIISTDPTRDLYALRNLTTSPR
jgi:hypothetical protein